MSALGAFLSAALDRPVCAEIADAARVIASRLEGQAVLFYGSVLRTGDLDGVLDFYVLRAREGSEGFIAQHLWPDVSYHEVTVHGRTVRAKVATMTLATFARAACGETLDTTIWARFVQPSALIWASTPAVRRAVVAAVADAAITAGRFAALHGPVEGTPASFWRSLFRATYATELRVEAPGREEQILANAPAHYDALLPLAWAADGIGCTRRGDQLAPLLAEERAGAIAAAWLRHERAGKPLNLARLVKAAFTFDGATRYAVWKIERHTGLRIPVTPFRERHPIIAAPQVLWRLWRHSPS
ncbi:hypothetical protein SAMN06297144_2139 [Sphingomonas guangdongensis]|uniref:Uncharacterized protein n=1 Tax=Sphingomonas guangdongensis TaxID=1141890 RepID=A0A285R033_9SPHN|nr:hypothetical protein [Sphingomonas guangdongensis]SOB87019.1 hypothetical protein SAMN06297144_2139 [Sphingomonas guangdongensis]